MHADLPPYPRLAEVLREVGKILETTPSERQLDEMIADGKSNYKRLGACQRVVFSSWKKGKEPDSAELNATINQFGNDLIHDYKEMTIALSVAGFCREQTIPWLLQALVAPKLVSFLQDWIWENLRLDAGPLIVSEVPVAFAFDWLKFKYPQEWNNYFSVLREDKAARDQYEGWIRGEYVPLFTNLLAYLDAFVGVSPKLEEKEAGQIREFFYLARNLAEIYKATTRYDFQRTLRNWYFRPNVETDHLTILFSNLKNDPRSITQHVSPLLELIHEIEQRLLENTRKTEEEKEEIDRLLTQAEELCVTLKQWNPPWWEITRLRGIWHLYSGSEKEAMGQYKRLFDFYFYIGAENLDRVFWEALAVAAVCNDRVFLRDLKSLGIVFDRYSEPIIAENSRASKKHEGHDVEDPEVLHWASEFKKLFPFESYFPGAIPPKEALRTVPGLLAWEPEDYDLQLKDWRQPLTQLKNIGGKRVSALSYFTAQGNVEVVAELLRMGADVNKLSSSNDSAFLIALQHTELPEYGPPDLRLFNLLSSEEHSPKTINTPTDKRKLTVLGCAVDTLIPGVVQKVLAMGANPNQCCDIDQISPLYKTIRAYAPLPGYNEVMRMFQNPAPELLESIRRYAPMLGGFDHKTAQQSVDAIANDPRFFEAFNVFSEISQKPKCDKNILQTVKHLLEHGADPNHRHNVNGWVGCTPLMLATEYNQPEVIRLMISKGGTPNLTAQSPDGRRIDSFGVAIAHNANEALNALRK